MPPFAALRAFEAYARHGRVRRAAAALGLSHTIVSRHLRTLEDWLGVMLVDRVNGRLTRLGEEYHALIAPAFDQLASATAQIRGTEGRLTIWAAPGFAYLCITSKLPGFSQENPGLAIDLRPADIPPDLARREADGDIRWLNDFDAQAEPAAQGLRHQLLARPRIFPVARPDAPWLNAAAIASPGDLLALPLLHEKDDTEWTMWLNAQGLPAGMPSPLLQLWQAHMTLAAAVDGHGVALTNDLLARDLLAAGRLVEIGPAAASFREVRFGGYYLFARNDNWESRTFSRFRAWLVANLAGATGQSLSIG
ncbi:MAG: LysR family transcriptional regulator [Sphingopyxis sp.]|nr:LysR family transcriptional regulator [Sphingopyxis sp.]